MFSCVSAAREAPFIWMIGAILGIVGTFTGFDGEKSTIMAAIAEGLSESMMPAALGLGLAITALWGYKYLAGQMQAFETEMRNAIIELASYLSHCCRS